MRKENYLRFKVAKLISLITAMLLLQGVINAGAKLGVPGENRKIEQATLSSTLTPRPNMSVDPRRKLQVLYVVPRGQTAKPKAVQALQAIVRIIQNHYYEQLGVTFETESPLVSTVQIDQDVNYAVDWNNNVALVKRQLNDGYVTNENVVITVIEGATGDAGGSWNITKMPGRSYFDSAYDMFEKDPGHLATTLHGWSHELGHAFGLTHAEDQAKPCFAQHGVSLDTSSSLIMQKKGDLGDVNNYPFLPQEKLLLLNPGYYPDCRPLLSEPGATARPHASLHLRHKLNGKWINVMNVGAYQTQFTVRYYMSLGSIGDWTNYQTTSPLPMGRTTRIFVPGGTTRISVKGEVNANPMRMIFEVPIETLEADNVCFTTAGLYPSPTYWKKFGDNCFETSNTATTTTTATVPTLNGNWAGYYSNGSKSPYVWAISQTGSTLSFADVGAGSNVKFSGRVEGNKITDSSKKTGTLSADGKKITWSDGVVWVRQ